MGPASITRAELHGRGLAHEWSVQGWHRAGMVGAGEGWLSWLSWCLECVPGRYCSGRLHKHVDKLVKVGCFGAVPGTMAHVDRLKVWCFGAVPRMAGGIHDRQ